MIMNPVNSRDLKAVGYDVNHQLLKVEFKKGGVYQYQNVPQVIYQQLMSAPSKGTFFTATIRNNPLLYPFQKVSL